MKDAIEAWQEANPFNSISWIHWLVLAIWTAVFAYYLSIPFHGFTSQHPSKSGSTPLAFNSISWIPAARIQGVGSW